MDNPFQDITGTVEPVQADDSTTTPVIEEAQPQVDPQPVADDQPGTTEVESPQPEVGRGSKEPLYQTKYQQLKADYDAKMAEFEKLRNEPRMKWSNQVENQTPNQPAPARPDEPRIDLTQFDLTTYEGLAAYNQALINQMQNVTKNIPQTVSAAMREELRNLEAERDAGLTSARAQALLGDFVQRNEVDGETITKVQKKMEDILSNPLARAELIMDLIRREYKQKYSEKTVAKATAEAVEKITAASQIPNVSGSPPKLNTQEVTPEINALNKFGPRKSASAI